MNYTVRSLSQFLNVCEATIRRWTIEGKLKAEKDIPKRIYYKKETIDEFLEKNPQYKQDMAMEQEKKSDVNNNIIIVVLVDIEENEIEEKEKRIKEKYSNYKIYYVNKRKDLCGFIELLVKFSKNIKEVVLNKDFEIKNFSLIDILNKVNDSVKFNIVLDEDI